MRQRALSPPPLGPGRPNLVLSGCSGSGKTTVGRLAAQALGMPFLDLDQLIEARCGVSVEEIFRIGGERGFRRAEARILEEAARLSGTVIASGGGAVLHPNAFAALARDALVVVLSAEARELRRRLARDRPRPLLLEVGVETLLEERATAYRAAGPVLDTTALAPEPAASRVAELYRERVGRAEQSISIPSPGGSYPYLVGGPGRQGLASLLESQLPGTSKVVVVSDPAVASTAGKQLAGLLAGSGRRVLRVELPAGEAAKQLPALAALWARLLELGVERQDLLVAVGGGATLDAAGFAAATLGRGLPWVTAPTTVLAMVDAAIGGKVAIDHAGTKNSVGAFHPPLAVIIDPAWLDTLDPDLRRDGLAEVVKSAVLASPSCLDLLADAPLGEGGIPSNLEWATEQAVRVKAAYVGADPYDLDLRQALNLGHTYAHGLEVASGYRLSHGRAVALGLRAAAGLGTELGLTPAPLARRIGQVLKHLGLDHPVPPGLDHDAVLRAVEHDKKRRGHGVPFLVPGELGAVLVEGLPLSRALEPLWSLDARPLAAASAR